MAKPKVVVSWSSGKDSAWTLHRLRAENDVEVIGLLTTITKDFGRVSMHAVRETLLEAQAAAADLPLFRVAIPSPCPNEVYEEAMARAVDEIVAEGAEQIAFGDLFLEDIRRYREDKLAPTAIDPIFPIWGLDTADLAHAMVEGGVRATITCVDPKQIDPAFAGRAFDHSLLNDLPAGADPCGENGEFHSFVHAGPMFSGPIAVEVGETVERDGFVFADVMPAD